MALLNFLRRELSWFLVFAALVAAPWQQAYATGTWTALPAAPASVGLMMLLPDGSVLAFGSGTSNTIYKLRPDALGHYATGTWSTLASMHDTRLYFASQVLKDGRVFVAGGEYGTGMYEGETYNPLTNQWFKAPSSGQRFSDADSVLLPDGRVLVALVTGALKSTTLYNPTTNTWATGPTTNGVHNESAWLVLPDNTVLFVGRDGATAERYFPSSNTWVVDSTVPVSLYDPYGSEAGGATMLPNGKALFIGSLGANAIYTPSGTSASGAWVTAATLRIISPRPRPSMSTIIWPTAGPQRRFPAVHRIIQAITAPCWCCRMGQLCIHLSLRRSTATSPMGQR